MQIMKERPSCPFHEFGYGGPVQYCNLLQRMRRSQFLWDPQDVGLTAITSEKPPIKKDKYKDLLTLCQRVIIPRPDHPFYLTLVHEKLALWIINLKWKGLIRRKKNIRLVPVTRPYSQLFSPDSKLFSYEYEKIGPISFLNIQENV